jgi:hypothetical protein
VSYQSLPHIRLRLRVRLSLRPSSLRRDAARAKRWRAVHIGSISKTNRGALLEPQSGRGPESPSRRRRYPLVEPLAEWIEQRRRPETDDQLAEAACRASFRCFCRTGRSCFASF